MSIEIQNIGTYTYAQRALVQPAGLPLEATVYIAVHWLQGYDLAVSDDRIKASALRAARAIDEIGNLTEALRFYARWGVEDPGHDDRLLEDSGYLARRALARIDSEGEG